MSHYNHIDPRVVNRVAELLSTPFSRYGMLPDDNCPVLLRVTLSRIKPVGEDATRRIITAFVLDGERRTLTQGDVNEILADSNGRVLPDRRGDNGSPVPVVLPEDKPVTGIHFPPTGDDDTAPIPAHIEVGPLLLRMLIDLDEMSININKVNGDLETFLSDYGYEFYYDKSMNKHLAIQGTAALCAKSTRLAAIICAMQKVLAHGRT